jgi:hypothetical protein
LTNNRKYDKLLHARGIMFMTLIDKMNECNILECNIKLMIDIPSDENVICLKSELPEHILYKIQEISESMTRKIAKITSGSVRFQIETLGLSSFGEYNAELQLNNERNHDYNIELNEDEEEGLYLGSSLAQYGI